MEKPKDKHISIQEKVLLNSLKKKKKKVCFYADEKSNLKSLMYFLNSCVRLILE